MLNIINKLNLKENMPNILMQMAGDLLMLALGLVIGYYLRIWVF